MPVYTVFMSDPTAGIQATSPEDTKQPERVIARPGQNSRLEALHAEWNTRKAEFEAAQARFNELKRAMTAELEAEYTGSSRPSKSYVIPASIYGPEIAIYYKEQDYLPSKPIKDNFPEIYNAFKQKKTFSEVRESQAGKPRGRK